MNTFSRAAEDNIPFAQVDDDGVTFKSIIDGSTHRFTPEKSIEIQHALGADIIFAFDECATPDASYEYQKIAMARTHEWAKRCLVRHRHAIPAKAGIQDQTLDSRFRGNDKQSENGTVESIQKYINSKGSNAIQFEVLRNGQDISAEVIPTTGLIEGKYAIGIAMQNVADLKLPFFTAIYEGLHYTIVMIKDTAVGLYWFFAGIIQGTANFSDVAGPIGIAGIVGNAAELGFTYLIMITAIISINLGVINLIPFPALDGGRILFVAIEGIIRRRIPAKFSNIVNTIGFVLLMALMVLVTYKDIAKLIK